MTTRPDLGPSVPWFAKGPSGGSGGYRTRLALIEALVPTGSTLDVGGVGPSASQISSVLGGDAQASSSLLLNLAQQLIATRLNVLQGIVPTPAVTTALVAADAGVNVLTGPPLRLTTTLPTAELSALVKVLTAFHR